MKRSLLLALVVPLLWGHPAPSPGAARVHTVRLSSNSARDQFRFSPARLTVSAGDTLRFEVESGGPHAIGIEEAGVSRAVLEAWNGALAGKKGFLRGPLLREGDPYLVVVPRGIPAGRYGVYCLAHRAYDMRLELQIR